MGVLFRDAKRDQWGKAETRKIAKSSPIFHDFGRVLKTNSSPESTWRVNPRKKDNKGTIGDKLL